VYRYFYQWFIGAALLLLLVEFFTSEKTGKTKFQSFFLKKNIFKDNAIKTTFNKAVMLAFCCTISVATMFAQKENALIKKGNTAYNNKQLDVAIENYKKAIELNPSGNKASFNLGNALYKNGNTEDAVKAYEMAIANSNESIDKSKAWYNTGVVLQSNNKLPESIDAYKNALKLNPADEDARINLQNAIKKQQQQKEKENADKKKEKPQQQKQDKQQPKPQPNKMTKKEAEEKLKALMQQEKNLQDKLRKVDAASPEKPEKDW
jgi:tetratricopeptide (TPR) repeat protein